MGTAEPWKGVRELQVMIQITLQVNALPGQAIGIKEDLAMYCERYGDTKIVKVEEILPEQLRMPK